MPVEAFVGGEENPYDVATKSKKQETRPARFWYPTLLLNVDVKKTLPKDGCDWLFVRVLVFFPYSLLLLLYYAGSQLVYQLFVFNV